MEKEKIVTINKTAVRRALTTLKKNNVIDAVLISDDNKEAALYVTVDADLIQPKKKVKKPYIRKRVKK